MESGLIKSLYKLKTLDSEIQKLLHIKALLEWDQETYLPRRAVSERAEQIALMEGIIHDKIVSPEFGELLDAMGASAENPCGTLTISDENKGLVRAVYRRYMRYNAVPNDLNMELARQTSLAQARWFNARKISDYSIFQPNLKTLINLFQQKTKCIGYREHPYDALLDEYEPWMTTKQLDILCSSMAEQLKLLAGKIMEKGNSVGIDLFDKHFDIEKQKKFALFILGKMGFDFQRGRVDISVHPFTTTLGKSDVRITTRYITGLFNSGLFGLMHEGGHGLYELGFSKDILNTILANGTSLGIHESQARFWENFIGKSHSFWKAFFPELQKLFPEELTGVDTLTFYKAVNTVKPSLIRVEADEVTYNLHIILRYRLEKALITGDLSTDDLPEAWRSESQSLLGVKPATDEEGVLQDIHWASGAFGYFPTYCLGNMYSAQFYHTLTTHKPQILDEMAGGNLFPVFNWLRENIHYYGSIYSAEELCRKITGESLNDGYFITYLEEKFNNIYEL